METIKYSIGEMNLKDFGSKPLSSWTLPHHMSSLTTVTVQYWLST